ncbi:MAG: FecR family protein [Terriglobales bacterium]
MLRRIVVATLALTSIASAATPAGSVAAVLPAVSITRGAGSTAAKLDAKKGTGIEPGDLLRTNDQGRVRLKMTDQSLISIGVNSELRIVRHDTASQQTALQLAAGKLRARVAKITRAGGNFEVSTPIAVAGVIGTDFGVDASDPDLTKFVCLSGTVEIRSADPSVSGTIQCHGGSTVTVRKGQPPDKPESATQDQMELWRNVNEPDERVRTPY